MDLRELLGALRKQWVPIVALTLVGAAAAFGFSVNQQKVWTAQATILVRPASGQSTTDLNSGAVFVERVVGTYAALAKTPVVLDPVAEELGLESSAGLQGRVWAEISSGTTFIIVSATWPDAQEAARVANAVADEMQVAIAGIAPRQQDQPSVVVETVSSATTPSSPSSPDLVANVLVGAFAGFLVGLGFVLLRSALDSRVRTASQARRLTSSPVLAEVAPPRRPPRTALPDADPWAEDYRRLRTNLRLLDVAERPASVVVTACTAGEGSATVGLGLARTAVEGGLSTVLVEADLRRPRLARDLGLPPGPGLSELLAGRGGLDDAVHAVDGVDVLPAGAAVANPGDVVTSPGMGRLLAHLVERYDLVVCVAPPVLTVTDAAALGAGTHGVVLVVGRTRVTSDQVAEAVDALGLAGASLLGVVLNDAADVAPAPLSKRAGRPTSSGKAGPRRGGGAASDRAAAPAPRVPAPPASGPPASGPSAPGPQTPGPPAPGPQASAPPAASQPATATRSASPPAETFPTPPQQPRPHAPADARETAPAARAEGTGAQPAR